MCLSPITILNPNRGNASAGFTYLSDTTHKYIQVPCGHCSQCASMRQGFFNQRIQMESLRSDLFFFTLTYNDESLIYAHAGKYDIPIPYYPDVQNMCKRIRRAGYKIRITYVSEYGTRRHRPHFHGILAVERKYDKSLNPLGYLNVEKDFKRLFMKEWRRNYGTSLNPVYLPLFTPVYKKARLTTFDFHYIEPIIDHDNDVSFYVSKYIQKYDSRTHKLLSKIELDNTLSNDETKYLTHLIKPRCVMSKDFGDFSYPPIRTYIRKCIDDLSTPLPQFYDIYTGKSCLLSPYYRSHLYTLSDAHKRLEKYSDAYDEGYMYVEDDSSILEYRHFRDSQIRLEVKHEKILEKMKKRFAD